MDNRNIADDELEVNDLRPNPNAFISLWSRLFAWLRKKVRIAIDKDKFYPWAKYLIVGVVLLVYTLVLGQETLLSYIKMKRQTAQLREVYEEERAAYQADSAKLSYIESGAKQVERLAREQYYMKEEGEDIYIISPDSLKP